MKKIAQCYIKGVWRHDEAASVETDFQKFLAPELQVHEYKWVFKIKHNGVCCARLVACVYSQIARGWFLQKLLDHHEWYHVKIAVAHNDVLQIHSWSSWCGNRIFTWRAGILLVWKALKKDNCIILRNSAYSLVQTAWQYNKNNLKILKKEI